MCSGPVPNYLPHSNQGLISASSCGDGYAIALKWTKAYTTDSTYSLGYNIYYSTIRDDVFKEGVKFVSDNSRLTLEITELTPGDTYYFSVRAFQYKSSWYNLSYLPSSGISSSYPEGVLLNDIDLDSTFIQISDIDQFPSFGVVTIGSEIIKYSNIDLSTNSLINLSRGFLGTDVRIHTTDGYDGIFSYEDSSVKFFKGLEENNTVVFQETNRFDYPNYPLTVVDGPKIGLDLVNTSTKQDDINSQFPRYDYVGWHRIPPASILRGDCVGSYIGGEMYCADGYLGVGRQIRGISKNDRSNQRSEMLLETTGVPVVLVRRRMDEAICYCYTSSPEYADDRCPNCYGTGRVVGYEQIFNSRRSDGRILVRFGPTQEDIKMDDAGLESVFIPDCWTLVYPTIKDRDFIIRFNEDGTEEFRYEILNVTRNDLFLGATGNQKFTAQRVRKTDPIASWRYISDTSEIPQKITTSIGFGPGIPPHTHTITINEKITSLSQINQGTSVNLSHNHKVINGIIEGELGHTHTIVLP